MNNIRSILITAFSLVTLIVFTGCKENRDKAGDPNNTMCGFGLTMYKHSLNEEGGSQDLEELNFCMDEKVVTFIDYDETQESHVKLKSYLSLYQKLDKTNGFQPTGERGFFLVEHNTTIDNNNTDNEKFDPKKAKVYCGTQFEDGSVKIFPIIDGVCRKDFDKETGKHKGNNRGCSGYYTETECEYTPTSGGKQKTCTTKKVCDPNKCYPVRESKGQSFSIEQKKTKISMSISFGKSTQASAKYDMLPIENYHVCKDLESNETILNNVIITSDTSNSKVLSKTIADTSSQSSQICKSVGDSKVNLGITSSGTMKCEGDGDILKDGAEFEVKNTVGSIPSSSIGDSEELRTTKTTEYYYNRSDLIAGAALSCPDTNGTIVIQKETTNYLGDQVSSKSMGFFDENGDECKFLTGYEECTKYEANPDNPLTLNTGMSYKQSADNYAKLQKTYSLGNEITTLSILDGEAYICGEENQDEN